MAQVNIDLDFDRGPPRRPGGPGRCGGFAMIEREELQGCGSGNECGL